MNARLPIVLLAMIAGCSSEAPVTDAGPADTGAPIDTGVVRDAGSLFDDGPATDRTTLDVPAIDAGVSDVGGPTDLGSDDVHAVDAGAASDVPAADVVRCDDAGACHPFWCGCGSCDPANIVCTTDLRGCPLGCVSSCPALDLAVCACNGSLCGAPTFRDAGVVDAGPRDAGPADVGTADAGASDTGVADAGGLAAGSLCTADTMCAPGLLCCYPCGIPGCMNRCGAPDPHTGRCPLLP